jgi:hypothetical protein
VDSLIQLVRDMVSVSKPKVKPKLMKAPGITASEMEKVLRSLKVKISTRVIILKEKFTVSEYTAGKMDKFTRETGKRVKEKELENGRMILLERATKDSG